MTIPALTNQITGKDRSDMTIAAENNQTNQTTQSRRSIRRLGVLAALAMSLLLPLVGGVHVTHAAGNSDAAHACQQGGYLGLKGSDGTTFKNEGQCVSYAAHGGTIVGINTCTVTSTTGCLTFNNAALPAVDSNGNLISSGNTITLTGSTSFVDTICASPSSTGLCTFTYPNANSLATGGGTYMERDSTGAVVSQGIYRIADTAGSSEGLGILGYQDSTFTPVSSCAAATGVRVVEVVATLIDSSTGATQTAVVVAATGTQPINPPLPLAAVSIPTTGDQFLGTVSSSAMSLTC